MSGGQEWRKEGVFGAGVHTNHQSLSPTEGETNFLMDLTGSIWNIKKKKKSESPSYNLDLSSLAYANISEDCTLKTSFATAYMKITIQVLCSRDR